MTSVPNNITKLVTGLVSAMQAIENQEQALLTQRSLATAIGAQLDVLGKIVGESRDGLSDSVYRLYIAARVAANRSDGTVEDLITVLTDVLGPGVGVIRVNQEGAAAVFVDVTGVLINDVLANVLVDFLRDSVSAGVKFQLGSKYQTDAASFATAPPQQTYGATSLSIGATSVQVDSTAAFAASGSIDVDVGAAAETATYTSKDATHFLGVSALTKTHATAATIVQHGATTVGKTFPNVALTQSALVVGAVAIQVDSTAGFANSGSLIIDSGRVNQETVTYTSKNTTFFLGVSALAKSHVISSAVELTTLPGGELAGARGHEYTLPTL